jgi:hypothetical protein
VTLLSNVHVRNGVIGHMAKNGVIGHMAKKRPAFRGTERSVSIDLDVILIQLSLVPPIQVLFHKIDFNNILPYTLRSLKRFLPFPFPCFH